MVSPKLITTHHFTDGHSQSHSQTHSQTHNISLSRSPQPSPRRVQNASPSFNTNLNAGSFLQHGDTFRLIRSPRGPSEEESLQKRRNMGARLQVNTSGQSQLQSLSLNHSQPSGRSGLNVAGGGGGLLPTVGTYPLCSPNMNVNFLPSPTCRLQNLLPSPANRMMLSPSNRLAHSPVNRLLLASPRFSFNLVENPPNPNPLKSSLPANTGQLAISSNGNGNGNGSSSNGNANAGGGGGVHMDGKRRPEDDLGFDDLLLYSDPFLGSSPAAIAPLTPMSSQGEPEMEPMVARQSQSQSQGQGQRHAQGEDLYKTFKRSKAVKQEPLGVEDKDAVTGSSSGSGGGDVNLKSMPGSAFSLEDSGVDEQLFSLNINPANLQLSLEATTPLPNENAPNSINKRRRIGQVVANAPFIDERKYVGVADAAASKLSQARGRETKGSRSSSSRSSTKGQTDREKVSIEFLDLVKKSSREKQAGMQQEFICPHAGCNRKFSWKWAMEEHARTHMQDSDRVHICSYCGKGFFTPGCLKSHTRIHTRKPFSYVCKVDGCDKKYSTSEGLRLHTRNHHDLDKKWKCPSAGCSKSFVRQSDMRLHIIRIHSTDRPYPCNTCQKSFACYSELKRHESCHLKKKKKKPKSSKGSGGKGRSKAKTKG